MTHVTVCMAVWNTSHLLSNSLHTYAKQTHKDFDMVIIDDCSEDSVEVAIAPYRDQLKIQVHRFEHSFGMRGNSISFNTAFSLAQGPIIFENTPEVMLYDTCIEDMVNALHSFGPKSWVSVRTYNLTPEDQLLIDTVDWRSDINVLKTLPNFNSAWTQNNVGPGKDFFGTHQTCVFFRDDWFRYWQRYPLYADYGTDDPANAGIRQRMGIQSATIKPMVWHQWHAPIGFWMAFDKAPNWNMWGHTLKNYYHESTIPEGGTAEMWDSKDKPQGQNYQMNEQEKEGWRVWKDKVIASGFRRKDGRDW